MLHWVSGIKLDCARKQTHTETNTGTRTVGCINVYRELHELNTPKDSICVYLVYIFYVCFLISLYTYMYIVHDICTIYVQIKHAAP